MKLSIVIPASGSQSDIDDTLVSVLENRPIDCEVLLVHSEAYVDPYELDDEIRLVASPQSDRLSLLNWGFAAAQGDIIHTLCPSITATDGWCESAIEAFEGDANLGSLAPTLSGGSAKSIRGIRYHVGRGRELVSKPGQQVLAPAMQTGFYLRTALQFMRGFDPRYADLADVELGLRMHSANYRAISCHDVRVVSGLTKNQPPIRGFRAGQIRGRLFQQAKAFGLASSQGLALLSEPLRNGFGIGAITGLVGRLACGSIEHIDTRAIDDSVDEIPHRNAA